MASDEIRAANDRYLARFTKATLPMPPARRFTVVTCMDARLDPARFLGLEDMQLRASARRRSRPLA